MPFTPTSIAGLQAWWDASQLTGLADGDPVATWTDMTGNGRHAAQGTAGQQPAYRAGFLNSLPVLQFDGVNDRMTTVYGPALGDFTVACVFNSAASGTTRRLIDKDYAGGFWLGKSAVVPTNTMGGGVKETAFPYGRFLTLADRAWHLIACRRAGTQHYLEGDGGTVSVTGAVDGTPTNAATFTIADAGGINYLPVYIAEILIFDQALSAGDLDTITGYLAWKWGQQASLPSGHPYKSAPPGGAAVPVSCADGPDDLVTRRDQIRQRDFLARQRDDEEVLEAVAQAFSQLCR